MQNNVRVARAADFDFVKNCWTECFDDDERYVNWNFSENYSAANTLVAECCGESAAAMQCIPYTLSFEKTDILARYISGVSTMPNFRNRGLARSLFEYALPLMRRQGAALAFLISAVDGMYEKFGFTKLCDRIMYRAESLGKNPIQRIDDINLDALDRIYERRTRETLHIRRTRPDWKKLLSELAVGIGGYAAIAEDSYCFAFYCKGGFEVYEKCGEFDFKPVRREPFMVRITDAEKFLKIFCKNFPDNVSVAVTDEFIPQNNGRFIISDSSVIRCDKADNTASDFNFTVSELCRFALADKPIFVGNII